MVVEPLRLFLSVVLSAVIGGLAFRHGSLSGSGWLGAVLVGTATAGLGGWDWGVLVIVFFVSSSALSHWHDVEKGRITADKFAKGERRDLAQTLANGGVAAGCAVLWAFSTQPVWFAAALGALATAAADTWATELGTLSQRRPRLITSLRAVEPGTSGGITTLGLAASLGGAVLLGAAAWLARAVVGAPLDGRWIVVALGGGVGALVDSVLGATVQRVNLCARCGVQTEQAVHRCGTATTHQRGWPWLGNDGVNLLATAAGAGAGAVIWLALGG